MNPLIRDRDVAFLLDDVLDVASLTKLPYFAAHDRESFELVLWSARRLARDVLWPAYKPLDAEPPRFVDGRVTVHPRMRALYPQMLALGLTAASRPTAVGGQQLPLTISSLASAYLMAANLSAYGYVGLTAGAAHLLEAFGSDELRARYMAPLYDGRWTGTMALTEPQAGSSLADVATRARDAGDGSFLLDGAKIFISGGDHDLTDNIVHMVLARIDGAPPGIKGVSLFCVPKRRFVDGVAVDNDVRTTGLIHKIGWRGLPSVALAFGERGDCRGWLVGEANRGIAYMFQMMNEARLMVGINGVASASVAYHQALAYAQERRQGRPPSRKAAPTEPVAIVEHPDVRRMLLRQKAIVEGGLALVARTAFYADLAAHGGTDEERARAQLLLDLLTPVAKSFPAERGFEANALALQVHGGYGYSSEFLPEAWLRDQKLNSIHEGTTGIQGLDLLGRKAVAGGGVALAALRLEIERAVDDAAHADVDPEWGVAVAEALGAVELLTMELGSYGLAGSVDRMLLHSSDYLELFGILVVAWQHLTMAAAARRRAPADADDASFVRGKLLGAEYFLKTELPRLHTLVALCRSGEDSYARIKTDEF